MMKTEYTKEGGFLQRDSLAPLRVEGYDKDTLIDTRYISMHRLEKYVQFNNKDILFLYNTALVNSSFVLK